MPKTVAIKKLTLVSPSDVRLAPNCMDAGAYEVVGEEKMVFSGGLPSSLPLFTVRDVNGTPIPLMSNDELVFDGNGTISFAISPGSVHVDANVILSGDAGNGMSIGSDGGLFSGTETVTSLTWDTPSQTLTYTDENGGITVIDLNAITDTYITGGSLDPMTGVLTLTDSDGATADIAISLLALRSSVTDNGDGTYTFADGSGTTILIDTKEGVSADADNSLVVGSDGKPYVNVAAAETVTTLVDNGDNTFTYTAEDGSAITFDIREGVSADVGNSLSVGTDGKPYLDVSAAETLTAVTTGVVAGHQIAVYTDEDGVDTPINETVTSLSYNQTTTVLTYTDEDGVAVDVDLSALTTDIYVNGATFDAGAMSLTLVDNSGTTGDVVIDLSTLRSVVTDNADGTYLHDDGNGVSVLIDTRDGISADAGNQLILGADLRPYFAATPETVTTLVDNGDNTFTYTNEAGFAVTFDAKEGVSVDALNSLVAGSDGKPYFAETPETVTDIADNGDGTYTYTNEAGATFLIDTRDGISADAGNQLVLGADLLPYFAATPETVTTLVDNGDNTFTYTNEAGLAVTFDAKEGVSSDALNSLTVGADGKPYFAETPETVTTLVDNGNNTFTYTNEDGVAVTFDSKEGVSVDALNSLTIGSDGKPYFAETPETVTTLVDNGDNTFTYTNESGVATTFDAKEGVSADALNSLVVGSDGKPYFAEAPETVTTLVDNGDNTFTYTNEVGVAVTFDAKEGVSVDALNSLSVGSDGKPYFAETPETVTTMVDNGDGTHTYTNEAGVTSVIDTRDGISADAGNSLLLGADFLPYFAATPETVTATADNGDGTYTYTNEAGATFVIDTRDGISADAGNSLVLGSDSRPYFAETPETVTTLVDNGNNTFTYTNEVGVAVTFDAKEGVSVDALNSLIVGSDGKPYFAETPETITTIVDNGDGTFTYTNEAGATFVIDTREGISADIGNSLSLGADSKPYFAETITTLVNNGDGTFTYTNENGSTTIITSLDGISADAGNSLALGTDGRPYYATVPETVTTLVDNGNGTYTYTSESAAITVLDVKEGVSTDVGNVLSVGADGKPFYAGSPGLTFTVADAGKSLFVNDTGTATEWRTIVPVEYSAQLAPVLDNTAITPPLTPNPGDSYIVAAVATGDWVGRENSIATWSGTAWVFYTPAENDKTTVLSGANAGLTYIYNAGTWSITAPTVIPTVVNGLQLCANDSVETNTGGAVIKDGAIYAWGDRGLGINGATADFMIHSFPVAAYDMTDALAIPYQPKFVNVWFSQENVWAIDQNGFPWAAGRNTGRQLGEPALASTANLSMLTRIPYFANNGITIKDVIFPRGVGNSTSVMMIADDGINVYVMGENSNGQLGVGTTTDVTVPTLVTLPNTSGIKQCAFSSETGLTGYILCNDGELFGSGDAANYKLGNGSTTDVSTWISIFTDVKQICTWGSGAIVLRNDGTAWGTGINTDGNLGNGTTTTATVWTQAVQTETFKELYTNQGITNQAVIAVSNTNKVHVAGSALQYSLGTNAIADVTTFTELTSTQAPYQGLVKSVVMCGNTTPTYYVLTSTGDVYSAGYNNFGQRGVGNNTAPSAANGLGMWRKMNTISVIADIRGGGLDDSNVTEGGIVALDTDGRLLTVGSRAFVARCGINNAVHYYNFQVAYTPF